MTKSDPTKSKQAAFTKCTAVTHWRQAFGEPPPLLAEARVMMEIISEYTSKTRRS